MLCQKGLCCSDSVRKQLFFNRVITLFVLHRSLSAKPAYYTSSVSLPSYLILFSKARKSRMLNNLTVRGYLRERICLWVVARIFGCKESGVEE